MRAFPGVILMVLFAAAASAQAPSAEWRTVSTPHFRVHYPAEYEAWTLRAASRLESIREAVSREAGYSPESVIDVLVMNPAATPNGLAWPILNAPRIVLYTEPPGPDEQIGAYSNWIDLLAVHEVTHIVHMLRPSRNPARHLLERVVPLDPITLYAPRWVLEGYATVVEGRLTGAGRPPSAMRALILRQWAANGRLPSYAQLNSDTRFLGMSMAYLAGSAYLEWLEARSGPESLRRLWTRLTARQRRSFSSAFIGVFGDTPERLYGQFTAELTSSALTVNRSGELREGDLWQQTPRASGDPAVSPDGTQVAIVIRERERPANLVVWSTGPPTEEERVFSRRLERLLSLDPEDFPPVRKKPLPRKAVHSFTAPDGGNIESPRWMPDGQSLLFSHRQPDAAGVLHHDLFRWYPGEERTVRVTHLANIHDADPAPDGKSAVGVRSRYGLSQVVSLDLDTGRADPLTEESLDVVTSHPRISRDGKTLVYVAHEQGRWSLIRRDLATGATKTISRGGANFASPEWSRTRPLEMYASLAAGGHVEIQRISETGEAVPVTRSSGGAFEPAPAPDGRVFFMGLDPDGLVVRVIDGASTATPSLAFDPALVPALPPLASPARSFSSQQLPPSRPYRTGRQELMVLLGQNFAPSYTATEAGIRLGDVVGRLDTIALASFGTRDGPRGLGVASVWRGWPVDVSAHIFKSEDQRAERDGLEVRGSWTLHSPGGLFRADAGGLTGDPLQIGFASVNLQRRQVGGAWRMTEDAHVAAEAGDLRHYRAGAGATIRRGSLRVGARVQVDRSKQGAIEIGGLASSILPRSVYSARVLDPALPAGVLTTDRYEGARLELTLPSLPFTTFYQVHQTRNDTLSLAGLEMTLASAPAPLLRLPAFAVTLGAARILDEPLKNDTKWWFGIRWLP